jgi:hypothetical protein
MFEKLARRVQTPTKQLLGRSARNYRWDCDKKVAHTRCPSLSQLFLGVPHAYSNMDQRFGTRLSASGAIPPKVGLAHGREQRVDPDH